MNEPTAQAHTPKRLDPWPVSIIAFFAVAITGCVVFVAFCNLNRTDLVAKDYYEQEIRYQAQMEKAVRGRAVAGSSEAITLDAANSMIRIAVPQTHARATGSVHLYRPSAASMDLSLPLALNDGGFQLIPTDKLAPGLWQVKVSWRVDQDEFYLERRLHIPGTTVPKGNVSVEHKG